MFLCSAIRWPTESDLKKTVQTTFPELTSEDSSSRNELLLAVVPHIANCRAHSPGLHLFCRKAPKQINRQPRRIGRSQPPLTILLLEDYRHSIVRWLHELIRVCSDDGVGVNYVFGSLVYSILPTTGEREQRVISKGDREWLLRLRIDLHPFKKQSAGTKQRRRFTASRNTGLVLMVSAFALIVE